MNFTVEEFSTQTTALRKSGNLESAIPELKQFISSNLERLNKRNLIVTLNMMTLLKNSVDPIEGI